MSEHMNKTRIIMNADMDQALNYLIAYQEKREKIMNMDSTSRKQHQRQFASVHFLIYGMEQFAGKLFTDDMSSSQSVVIIYEPRTKFAAECLSQQLRMLMYSKPWVGIKLSPKDKFDKTRISYFSPGNEYRIYIGDFKDSKSISDRITDWKFYEFGFRYGWIGQDAVISFGRKPSHEEFYKMIQIAETKFFEANQEIDMLSKLEEPFWDEFSPPQKIAIVSLSALALLITGGAVAAVAGQKSKTRKNSNAQLPYILPDERVENLSADKVKALMEKTSKDNLTDEEWEYMMETSPEYAEEWLDRDDNLRDMSLEKYDDLRGFSDYSGIDFDNVIEWKGYCV